METGVSDIIIVLISVVVRLVMFLLLVLSLLRRVIPCLAISYPTLYQGLELPYIPERQTPQPLPPFPTTGHFPDPQRTGSLHGIDLALINIVLLQQGTFGGALDTHYLLLWRSKNGILACSFTFCAKLSPRK